MPKDFDWSTLHGTVSPSTTILPYEDVKNSFRKIAFDVYKQFGHEKLWELREENGEKFLIALYDGGSDSDIVVKSKDDNKNDWVATADSEKRNVTLSFKNTPVAKFAAAEFEFTEHEADNFAHFVEQRAASPEFVAALVDSMPDKKREAVLKLLQEGAI